MSEINVAKLVSSFRFAVDQKSVQEIDKLLKKYSKTKLEIGTKVGKTTQSAFKQEAAGIKALTGLEANRFQQFSKNLAKQHAQQSSLQRQKEKSLKEEIKLNDKLHQQALNENKLRDKATRQYGKGGYSLNDGRATPNVKGRVYSRYFGERSAAGNMVGSNRTFGGTYHGVMAGGGLLTGFGLMALNDRLKKLEAAPMGIQAGANLSRPQAMQHMNYISGLAQEVGATRLDLIPSYTQFLTAATGTPLEKTAQESFRHFTRYGKALNLDPQAMLGGLKAIRQITSKGRLYAEEVMGQLGEHFPGAVGQLKSIVADKYGKDKDFFKMMEKGELDPNVLLPLLARALGAKADTIDEQRRGSIDFAQGKARFAFESLLMKFGEGGGNSAFRDFYNTLSTTLPKMEGLFTSLASAAGTVVTAIGFVGQGLQDLSDKKATVESSFTGIAIAAAMLGTKLGRAFLPLTATFMLLEDLAMYKSGKGRSLIGYLSGEEDEKLRVAKESRIPQLLRPSYSDDPYSTNFNPNITGFEKISKLISEHPHLKWLSSKVVGESSVKLTPDTQMDAIATDYLKTMGGVDLQKLSGMSDSPTVVNITIDGITRKMEQDRNNAGSFFIDFGR